MDQEVEEQHTTPPGSPDQDHIEEPEEVIEPKEPSDIQAESKFELEDEEPDEDELLEQRHRILHAIKKNPLYPVVYDILLWRVPLTSGLYFGILNFFFFLITVGDYTVLSLLSYLHLTILLVCLVYVNGTIMFTKFVKGEEAENPFVARWKDYRFSIPRETLNEHLESFDLLVNALVDLGRDVFYGTKTTLSLKFAGAFWASAIVGNIFSGTTLMYLLFLISFGWPRLYEEKKTEVNHFCHLARDYTKLYWKLVMEKLPIKKKQH